MSKSKSTLKRKAILNPPKQLSQALNGFTKSYELDVANTGSVLAQLQQTRHSISELLSLRLEEMKGMKFMETLVVIFEKDIGEDEFTYKTAYFNSKTKTVTNFGGISQVNSAQDEILHIVGVWISEGSGWTIDSVSGHFLNISKYKPLKGSSYIWKTIWKNTWPSCWVKT